MQILRYPHPALRRVARPLRAIDKNLRQQAEEMFQLMYEAKGIGLAATQVGLPYQFLVLNLTADPKQPDQEKIYINPVLVERKGTTEEEEGCLSLPGLFKTVRRAKNVKVQAYDLMGQLVELATNDLAARALQHEIDHLGGILFIDKIGAIAKLSIRGKLKDLEYDFRRSQEKGEIPADVEIEKMLAALEAS